MKYFWGAVSGAAVVLVGWAVWILATINFRPSFPVWPLGHLSSMPVLLLGLTDIIFAVVMGVVISRFMTFKSINPERFVLLTIFVAGVIGFATVYNHGLAFIPLIVWILLTALFICLWIKDLFCDNEENYVSALIIGPGVGVGVTSGALVGVIVSFGCLVLITLIMLAICMIGLTGYDPEPDPYA